MCMMRLLVPGIVSGSRTLISLQRCTYIHSCSSEIHAVFFLVSEFASCGCRNGPSSGTAYSVLNVVPRETTTVLIPVRVTQSRTSDVYA